MVEPVTHSRLVRWTIAAACGPLTGPLALQSMACARVGDRAGAIAYASAIPAVWMLLAVMASVPWTR